MMILRTLLLTLSLLISHTASASETITWTSEQDSGATRVHLYFFWSQKCPHCLKAVPFIESLAREHAWLDVHSAEVSQNREKDRKSVV